MRKPFLHMGEKGFEPWNNEGPQDIGIEDGGGLRSEVITFGDDLDPLCLTIL